MDTNNYEQLDSDVEEEQQEQQSPTENRKFVNSGGYGYSYKSSEVDRRSIKERVSAAKNKNKMNLASNEKTNDTKKDKSDKKEVSEKNEDKKSLKSKKADKDNKDKKGIFNSTRREYKSKKKIPKMAGSPVKKFLIGVAVVLIVFFILSILLSIISHDVIDPISSAEGVEPKELVTNPEYADTINQVINDLESDNPEHAGLSGAEIIRKTFEDNASNQLTITESLQEILIDIFGYNPDEMSDALTRKVIRNITDRKLVQMQGVSSKDDIDLDKLPTGILYTTFTYAYSSQWHGSDNEFTYTEIVEDPVTGESKEVTITTDRIDPSDPIRMLSSLINSDILEIDDIQNLVNNLVFHEFYPTYKITTVTDDSDSNNKKVWLECKMTENESYKINYDKYNMYLRFGEKVSGRAYDSDGNYEKLGDGDVGGLTGYGYEYYLNLKMANDGSSPACILDSEYDKAVGVLEAQYAGSDYTVITDKDSSVSSAMDFFSSRGVTNSGSYNTSHEVFDEFEKYLLSTNSEGYENKEVIVEIDDVEYSYKDGFIFNRFPYYRDEFQRVEGTTYVYQNISTPITIEERIKNINELKDNYNLMLGYNTTNKSSLVSNSISSSMWWPVSKSVKLVNGIYVADDESIDGNISSGYGHRDFQGGQMHNAIDITTSGDATVFIIAAKSGTVAHVVNGCVYNPNDITADDACGGGYGNYVTIQHSDGTKTLYAHMNSVYNNISVGTEVVQGQVLGVMGTTGNSTGVHLHFEVLVNGNTVDPNNYVSLENPRTSYSTYIAYTEGVDVKQSVCLSLKTAFNDNSVAAILANMNNESDFDPETVGDSGTSYGLIQWHNTRYDALMAFAPDSYKTVPAQLNFMMYELNDSYYSDVYDALVAGSDAYSVAYDFCYNYEIPSAKETSCPKRARLAEGEMLSYVERGCSDG